MNNLRFLNHPILLSLDPNILESRLYPEYMAIYRFFPNPPGVEFFHSRNLDVDLKAPWDFVESEYPMPEQPANPVTFDDAADTFGADIIAQIDQGKHVYLMWSGGIDSTVIAVSILKHINFKHYGNLHIVLSDLSRAEHPMFYHTFLKEFDQIELHLFDPATLDLGNSIIIDGEGGDQTFGSSAANKIFSIHPDKIMLPWRSNRDFLRQYWYKDSVPEFYDFLMHIMETTINVGSARVETLYDFFWWLNFNFKFDSVMYRHTLRLSETIPDNQFEYFANTTIQRLYASKKMQQWSMTCSAEDKIRSGRKTIKWAARRYIYNFDGNEYYFREKRKEFSSSTIADATAKYIAVDKDYKRYTIAERSVRQQLRKTFYPDTIGKIEMPALNLWKT